MMMHVFVGDGGPGAGFMHPLTGLDHLLAMYAVGVVSAQIGGRAIWTVPSAFVLMMIVGGILGATSAPLPGTELGVAMSVVILGVAVAGAGRVPAWSALAAAGFFGVFHGFAHGGEMPTAASPALYALGFAVSTAGLHVLGALTGLLALCRREGHTRLRWAGVAIGLAGLCFVTAVVR
jgi:urease accessory protein